MTFMKFASVLLGLVLSVGIGTSALAQEASPTVPEAIVSPIASPLAVAEVVPVSTFIIYHGDCTRISGEVAHPFDGTDETGTGAGVLAPWGGGNNPTGALGAILVLYGEGVLSDINLGQLLDGRTTALIVRDGSTGEVMACGEIGGVVEKANHFWQHDRLLIGLIPTGATQIWGIATFTEDTGVRTDRINVSVALVTAPPSGIIP